MLIMLNDHPTLDPTSFVFFGISFFVRNTTDETTAVRNNVDRTRHELKLLCSSPAPAVAPRPRRWLARCPALRAPRSALSASRRADPSARLSVPVALHARPHVVSVLRTKWPL